MMECESSVRVCVCVCAGAGSMPTGELDELVLRAAGSVSDALPWEAQPYAHWLATGCIRGEGHEHEEQGQQEEDQEEEVGRRGGCRGASRRAEASLTHLVFHPAEAAGVKDEMEPLNPHDVAVLDWPEHQPLEPAACRGQWMPPSCLVARCPEMMTVRVKRARRLLAPVELVEGSELQEADSREEIVQLILDWRAGQHPVSVGLERCGTTRSVRARKAHNRVGGQCQPVLHGLRD